jgi:nicotinate-nucleotide--dimethylbenzimidazole phosphoribosyltransferase
VQLASPQETVADVLKKIQPVTEAAADGEACASTFPLNGLGQLGKLATRLGAMRDGPEPAAKGQDHPLRKLLLIAAADHGVGRHGISHYPQSSTTDLVRDVLAGRAAVARLAPRRQVRAVVVDVGLAEDFAWKEAGWADFDARKVAKGTADIIDEPAMDRDTALAAIEAGINCFRRWSSGWDVDLFGVGDVGLGSSVSACALAAIITDQPVQELTGNDARPGHTTRSSLVALALERVSPPDPHDAVGLLAEYGGLEIAALTGAYLAAAADRVPILLDGAVSTAAAAIAGELAPAARGYLIASHRAALPAHGALLAHLSLEPLLQLQLDLGEGVGSLLAMDLVEAALELGGAAD